MKSKRPKNELFDYSLGIVGLNIGGLLGQGAHRSVRKGIHKLTNEAVAVKLLQMDPENI